MMKRKIKILCVCAFLLTLYSCDNLMNSKGGGVTSSKLSSMRGSSNYSALLTTGSGGVDLTAIPRFHTSIQASGTFKPDEPIKIKVSVRTNLSTKNAQVRLFLPAIQALKQSQPSQPAIIPVGEPLKPEASWSQALSKGQVFSRKKTITVKQPGYYHVFVKVIAKNAKQITKDGKPIVNSHWSDGWLWISPKGGKMTKNFQYELFPKNMRPQPGPLTSKTETSPLQYGKVRPNSQQGSITFQVNYLDKYQGQGGYKPLKNAWIKYKVQYNGGSQWIQKYTNSQGIAVIPCIFSSGSYTVKVKNQNNNVKIYNGPHGNPGNTLAVETAGNIATDCGHVKVIQSENSYDLATFNQVIVNSRSFFQHSRGKISVYRIYNDDPQGGNSGYFGGGDYIVINDYNVGTDYGNFGIAHEYGHALQNKALGGIPNYTCSSSGHYISGEYNLKCAYFEGFADYHAAVTSTNISHYFAVENDPYVNNGEDGSIIEGAVAGFFWDLTDPANESFDNADNPGSYIADIIQSCQVKVNGNWRRADGIDELIACFQHRIPDYYNHFPTRNNYPHDYQEDATEPPSWNATDIGKLWQKDLYDESYTPPPLNVSISGPHIINGSGSYTWEANVDSGPGNYSYQWEWEEQRGMPPWVNVGTNQSYSRYIQQPVHTKNSALKVIVTSGSRQGYRIIDVTINKPGCPPHQICPAKKQKNQ